MSSKVFPNGFVLLGENIQGRESVAFSLCLPAGSAWDRRGRYGLASFLCEMMLRGAGRRDNRAFIEEIDRIGIDRSEVVSPNHLVFQAIMHHENLVEALRLYADVVRRPVLPVRELDLSRAILLQDILAVQDDPAGRLMRRLKERFYGPTWGHHSDGNEADVRAISWNDIRSHYDTYCRPNGAILAVAGKFDWNALVEEVTRLFTDWEAKLVPAQEKIQLSFQPFTEISEIHQTHIGLVWETLPPSHPKQLAARAGVDVLGGGMNSRLFNEVREKRGLCYSVDATCHAFRRKAGVFCYAGSRAENAQETLDVMLEQIANLRQGITQSELDAFKARYRTSLVMARESSSAVSTGLVSDWQFFGRLRSDEEILDAVAALKLEEVNAFLAENPIQPILFGILGRAPLHF